MQISIPRIADNLTYSVVAALGVDIMAAIVLVSMGAVLPALIPLALAVGVYWFVYRNLEEDITSARPAAAIIASAHLAFAVGAAVESDLFGFVFCGIVAACLGYVFVELGQAARR